MTTRNIDRTYGHIDLSTRDEAPHVTKTYSLKTHFPDELDIEVEQVWEFSQRMPVTVAETLDDTDWDLVLERMQRREGECLSPVENIIFSARCNGFPAHMVVWKVGEQVARNLYRRFCEKQIQKGSAYDSQLAWVAPSSMSKGSNPNG